MAEEFRVGRQAAQEDLLLELPSEEAPALLLAEALTAPVAPVLTVRVPVTARLTALAHLTAQALAPPLTAQDPVLPSLVCRDMTRQVTTQRTPSQGLHQAPRAVRYDKCLETKQTTFVSERSQNCIGSWSSWCWSRSSHNWTCPQLVPGVQVPTLSRSTGANPYQEYRCQNQPDDTFPQGAATAKRWSQPPAGL